MEKTLTAREIQWDYPKPRSGNENTSADDYCVGGAFCLCMKNWCELPEGFKSDENWDFPTTENLSQCLAHYDENRKRPEFYRTLAFTITHANDEGKFDKGWRLLGNFLCQANGKKRENKNHVLIRKGRSGAGKSVWIVGDHWKGCKVVVAVCKDYKAAERVAHSLLYA